MGPSPCRQRKRLTTGEALTASFRLLLGDEVRICLLCRSGTAQREWVDKMLL